MGGETTSTLSNCFGESEVWDSVSFSDADDIFGILEESINNENSFEFQTSSSYNMHDSPLPSAKFHEAETDNQLAASAAAFSPKLKRQKMNIRASEEGKQRTTHVTVERNRRKQMNHHLSMLRSLMPCFYVKRGDQASIIGGVVDYIHELKQLLLSLEAKKQRRAYNEALSPRLGLPISPRTPQPSSPYLRNRQAFNVYLNPSSSLPSPVDRSPCNSSTSSINESVNELVASSKSAVAEVVVKFSGSNLLLSTVSRRVPAGQVLKIISALEQLSLEILKVRISTLDEMMVLNSFTIKIGIGCQISAEDLAHQIQQTFS